MVADRARDEDAVARAARGSGTTRSRLESRPTPAVVTKSAVGAAALDHLGVARRRRRRPAVRGGARPSRRAMRRRSATGKPSSITNPAESHSRLGAGDGEVVDRPVDGQLADVSAREEERLDDVRVGREREPGAAELAGRCVAELVEQRVRELFEEEALDEPPRRLAARAVGERDELVGVTARVAAIAVVGGAGALGSRPCRCRAAARGCRPCRRPCTRHGLIAPTSTSPHWHAFGSATRARGSSKRASASQAANSGRSCSALHGIQPRPRHSKVSRSSIVSSIAASARGFPSGRTTRVYWFSTSQRPSRRWRRIIAVDVEEVERLERRRRRPACRTPRR